MKNDEMVTDANMLVTQNTITQDQIEEVNVYLEYEEGSRLLTNLGYSFYYNLMQQNMHPADADRYANLNTILGYDVGKDIFTLLTVMYGNTIMIFWSFPVPKKIKKSWRMQQKNYRCLWTFQNGKIYPDSSMIICFLRGQDLLGPIILRTATVLYLKHIHLLESMMKQYRSHV